MKALAIFTGTFIILNLSACVTGAIPTKLATNQFAKIATSKPSTGGNPEVNLNLCLQKDYDTKVKCLDRIFPNSPTILLIPTDNRRILLAGRGDSVERKEITIKNDDILLLNIDISHVKAPLSCNIKTMEEYRMQNSIVLSIPVQDIIDKVTLKDREGKVVLEYTIIKK